MPAWVGAQTQPAGWRESLTVHGGDQSVRAVVARLAAHPVGAADRLLAKGLAWSSAAIRTYYIGCIGFLSTSGTAWWGHRVRAAAALKGQASEGLPRCRHLPLHPSGEGAASWGQGQPDVSSPGWVAVGLLRLDSWEYDPIRTPFRGQLHHCDGVRETGARPNAITSCPGSPAGRLIRTI